MKAGEQVYDWSESRTWTAGKRNHYIQVKKQYKYAVFNNLSFNLKKYN